MTTESNPPDGGQPEPDGDGTDDGKYVMSRAEAKRLFALRDEAKELRDYKAQKEKEEADAEKARLLQEKEYEKLLEAERNEKSALAKKLQDIADAEAAAAMAAQKAERREAFLDAIEKKSNLKGKRVVLDGLLAVKERKGFDGSPETFGEKDVAEALKWMQESDPSTFAPKDVGAKGAPGGTDPDPSDINLTERQRQVRELAARMSPRQKRAG